MPPFVRFHDLRHPTTLGEADVKAFLVHLAEDRHLAPSTLAQALAALMFLYKEVLGQPMAGLGAMPRARAPLRLPVVLTPKEVRDVVGQLCGTTRLIGILLYGSGIGAAHMATARRAVSFIDGGWGRDVGNVLPGAVVGNGWSGAAMV